MNKRRLAKAGIIALLFLLGGVAIWGSNMDGKPYVVIAAWLVPLFTFATVVW